MKFELKVDPCDDFDDSSDTLDAFRYRVMGHNATLLDERIRLLLRPKPVWMPEKSWKWLIGLLLEVEVHKP